MVELIAPSKEHEYVVGIDFGHAETSACVCKIEWDISADKQRNEFEDLILYRNSKSKIITSAISKTKSGEIYIHDDAFKFIDGNNCRIGFKEKPHSINGEQEQLMVDFMHAVYDGILKDYDYLKPNNHIVYIARPSGWQDEESKDLYKRMAQKAGIPLAGLTSESRAAIFYAKQCSERFASNVTKGAIVFDLGSSTLDLTYLSEKYGPYDQGQNLGASIIDDVIFKYMILEQDGNLKGFVDRHPEFIDPLLYEARKFKEKVYSASQDAPSWLSVPIKRVLTNVPVSVKEELAAQKIDTITLDVDNANQLDALVDQKVGYRGKISDFLRQFKSTYIQSDHPINGVLLVGGASSMYYLPDLISRSLGISNKLVRTESDPNLTVSRGIALLGTKDAITYVKRAAFEENIREKIEERIDSITLKEELTDCVFGLVWSNMLSSVKNWRDHSKGVDKDALSQKIIDNLEGKLTNHMVHQACKNSLKRIIKNNCQDLLDEINDAIHYYAPEKEVSSKDLEFDNVISDYYIEDIISDNKIWFTGIVNFIKNGWLDDWFRHIFGKDNVSRQKMYENFKAEEPVYREILSEKLIQEEELENATSEIKNALVLLMAEQIKEVQIPIE